MLNVSGIIFTHGAAMATNRGCGKQASDRSGSFIAFC